MVQGSKHPSRPRLPASPTVFDTDASGPEITDSLYLSTSSIPLFASAKESSNLPTTILASPLFLPSTSYSACREDTRFRQVRFASPWTSSTEWTPARPRLKARLWHSPHCSKSGSTDQRNRVGPRQARGKVARDSERSPRLLFLARHPVARARPGERRPAEDARCLEPLSLEPGDLLLFSFGSMSPSWSIVVGATA